MRPAPERLLDGRLRVIAPFEHEGAARSLMHLLKYRGLTGYAQLVAEMLAERLPEVPLVPVPRAISRRVRYGVDPALVIARAISVRSGQPVVRALAAPLHSRRRAGGDHSLAPGPFRLRRRPSSPVIAVDDVVTTGSTLSAAVAALGDQSVTCAAAANLVSDVSSLSDREQTR